MSGTTRRIAVAKTVCALLAVSALAVFAGCSGHTTGASDIKRQPDGTYSAKLNAIGSCDKGSPSTPCTGYMRWRVVGTSAWTNGPTRKVSSKVNNVRRSQTATGLSTNTKYEYQVCGKEFANKSVVCVGPDATDPNSTARFATGGVGSPAGGQTPNKAGTNKHPGKTGQPPTSQPGSQSGTQTPASEPTNGASQTSSSGGGGGGTSPLVPIAIGVGTGVLVLGGTWWAERRFRW